MSVLPSAMGNNLIICAAVGQILPELLWGGGLIARMLVIFYSRWTGYADDILFRDELTHAADFPDCSRP